jgi:hypothetical protein
MSQGSWIAWFDNEHHLCVFEQEAENNNHFSPANGYGPIIDYQDITILPLTAIYVQELF